MTGVQTCALPISDEQEAQRIRLMMTSHLDDGEFARLLYGKVGDLIGPVFAASIERAVAAGDASQIGSAAHRSTCSGLPITPC